MNVASLAAFLSFSVGWSALAASRPVRNVDARDVPDAQSMASQVRRIGNAVYPQILDLLGNRKSDSPQCFDVVLREHLAARAFHPGDEPLGETCRKTVFLNAGYLKLHPDELDAVLVHELTHVAQNYPNIPFRHAWQWYAHTLSFKAAHPFTTYPRGAPTYWTEGIADYVCAKLGHTNTSNCPQCDERYSLYSMGYSCASAFLLYIDVTYGTDVIRQLNASLRKGADPERFFAESTGKTLAALWTDFQSTSAYTAGAAEFNELHDALGYINGDPPKDLPVRLEKYLALHPEVREFLDALDRPHGPPPDDVQRDIEYFLYIREQPGGEQAVRAIESNLWQLRQALGYKNGKAPPDIQARLLAYLDAHPAIKSMALSNDWLERASSPEIRDFIAHAIIDQLQPGWQMTDAAEGFLTSLKDNGALPGWRKSEHGTLTFEMPVNNPDDYPIRRVFKSQKQGRTEIYVFTVVKDTAQCPWVLKRAWETAANGRVLKDFNVR